MNTSSAASRLGSVAVALSTALVLVAVAILPFLTPAWVGFEQGRAGVGTQELINPRGCLDNCPYSAAELRFVTNSILADLVLGPPDFDVQRNAKPVLTESERAHMRDVRSVFATFYIAAAVAAAILGLAFWLASRGRAWDRRRAWHGVRYGALGLAGGIAVAGVIALVAFDAAFAVFHQLFFAGGNYLFDPRTSKLVQLFPDAFWFETSVVVGGVILVLALATTWLAGRRLRAFPEPLAARRAEARPGTDSTSAFTTADPEVAR